jgi:hypothetical protein
VEIVRDDPLVIFCSPRGGSSLVAGAFVNHGFWTGETFGGPDGRGSGGYVNHENAKIKAWMKDFYPLNAGIPNYPFPAGDLRRACRHIVPLDGVWLFKGPSEYYPVFRHSFPNMRAVMVFRDRTQAVEAHVRRRGEKVRENASVIVSARYDFMEKHLSKDELAWRVDADRLVNGDPAQLAPVLAEYGIELDHRLAMKSIDPDLFHQ